MKKLILLLLTISASLYSIAQGKAKLIEKVEAEPGSVDISYEKWELSNGMTIFIHEDHSDPIAELSITYKVGSNREKPGMTGFAHLFEHMLFEGSVHIKDGDHGKIVQEIGGRSNANTTSDRTYYHQTFPSANLETIMWLESDRMGYYLDSITKEKFETQRAAVKNEKEQRVNNQPYVLPIWETLPFHLYPQGHPYSWSVIGYTDDLDRVQYTHLKDFYIRWYGPNNATMVIAGDVDPKQVISLIEKYFSDINPGPPVQKLKPQVPILPTDKYITATDNIYLPMTYMTYPAPENYDRDEPAMDLLTAMIGQGRNSVLYQNLVKKQIAVQANAQYQARELAGEFSIVAITSPQYTFNEIEDIIRKSIEEFGKTGITQEALDRVKARTISGLVGAVSSVSSKASFLSTWDRLVGRTYNMSDEIARYEKVTKEDIIRVFNKYINGKKAAIMNVSANPPGEEEKKNESLNPYANIKLEDKPILLKEGMGEWQFQPAKETFDRSQRPELKPAKAAKVPEYYEAKLSNGISIIGTKSDEIPKVSILINVGGGSIMESDPKKTGISDLTAEMMNEGTKNYTAEQIDAELDKIGSSIRFSSGTYNDQVFVQCMDDKVDRTMELLEEMLFRPRFDEESFKRIHKQNLQSLNQAKKTSGYLGAYAYNQVLYGETPLGTTMTLKTARKISLDDVKEFYKNHYSPSLASVVVVGNTTKEAILPKLNFLTTWEGKKATEAKLAAEDLPEIEETTIYVIHKQKSPQSMLYMGYRSLPYDALGEQYKTVIMNYPLAGSFNGRVNQNLREDKGYTYGIYGFFNGHKLMGEYSISGSIDDVNTANAIKEVMKELKQFKTSGITEDELSFTQKSILQSDALNYETPIQKARFLQRILENDLEKGYREKQKAIIANMTKAEIDALAKKHIKPEEMAIVIVGNKYRLKDELEALGYGKIKEITID